LDQHSIYFDLVYKIAKKFVKEPKGRGPLTGLMPIQVPVEINSIDISCHSFLLDGALCLIGLIKTWQH
jgi:hypothetical protein